MSIARGFQFAGAQNLLFSLWNVNDYTTSVFMDYFYKEIKHNSSFVHAAANAKRAFLGVYHKMKGIYLQNYLDEFCYKLNRRYFKHRLFDRVALAVITCGK